MNSTDGFLLLIKLRFYGSPRFKRLQSFKYLYIRKEYIFVLLMCINTLFRNMEQICITQRAQPSVLWQPKGVGWGRWERGSRGRGYMYNYGWFTLYGRNQHCKEIILQLKIKIKNKWNLWGKWDYELPNMKLHNLQHKKASVYGRVVWFSK